MPTDPTEPHLSALAERFWDGYLAANPTFSTVIGDRRFDDRLDDPTPDGRASEIARLEAVAEAARAIEPDELGPEDRVTRSALIDEVEGGLALLSADLRDFTIDPLEGPQVALLNLEAFQTIETPELGEALLARWRAVAGYLDASAANLRRGLANGRVGVRSPIINTLGELRDLDAQPIHALPLLRPLRDPRPDWTPAARATFDDDLEHVVRDEVLPAFRRYRTTIEDEILPHARADDRPGLVHLPGGPAAYRALIRHHTTLDLDPQIVHDMGLREVEQTDELLAELGGRTLGTSRLPEIQEALRSDPRLHFSTRDQVLEVAERSLRRAQEACADWFGRLPVADCEVVEIAEHEARHTTVAYYVWPTTDGSRPGRYYLNTSDPTTRPRYDAETLAFHEAVPGHHLQIAIAQERTDLPAFRRMLGPTAYSEGWALYAELLADEMGLFTSDLDRLGRVSSQAWRGARLVVDTGMHAFGWTRQQAIDYLGDHTALADNNVVNEVDRYIVWPGQALAYLTGQLEVVRLRRTAEAALGDRFRLPAFHDAVLAPGAVSLGTLATLVDAYVAAQRP